eukprot:364792-Chlamydomonas_euryale.AAC.6
MNAKQERLEISNAPAAQALNTTRRGCPLPRPVESGDVTRLHLLREAGHATCRDRLSENCAVRPSVCAPAAAEEIPKRASQTRTPTMLASCSAAHAEAATC